VRNLLVGLVVAACLAGASVPAYAHDAYDDSQSHPLRLTAYALNPIGFALEWTVMRPVHFLVSNPGLERVFGHVPHESPWGGYTAYEVD
jgi:hypothetical protein